MRNYFIHELELENDRGAIETSFVFFIACFYNKMFYLELITKKTISMKILVLRVIDSSRHRNCFLRGYIHSLFVSKALTRSYLARSGFHTNNS